MHIVRDEKKEKTLKYQLKDWILKLGYTHGNMTYWEYMRKIFLEVVYHNICKADRIQNEDTEKGVIWIVSTCVLLIPDYNFKLINYE